jgi:hypothetical protein
MDAPDFGKGTSARARGETTMWRSVVPTTFGGQSTHVGYCYPALVLEDTQDHIVTFQPVGTAIMRQTGLRGPGVRNMFPNGWDGHHEEQQWQGRPVVRAHPAGEPWSVWRWLEADGSWSSTFYMNLEQPWTRTPIGYDSHDWILDLVVRLSPFQAGWKDADELEWSVEAGVISVATANDIQTAGRRALRSAEALEWPFDEDWNQWLPDDDWPVPQMAPRWREVALSDRP